MSNTESRRAKVLADLQEALDDRQALYEDPEAYLAPLVLSVQAAAEVGDITQEDLREALDWADAAFASAEDARLQEAPGNA